MKFHFSLSILTLLALLLACQPSSGQAEAGEVQEKPKPETIVQDQARPQRQQLIVVTTNDWNDFQGSLQRYEGSAGSWSPVGIAIPIVVGKKGLAWGKGDKEFPQKSGGVKREGDLRSPAGWFNLGAAFGYAPAEKVSNLRFPYLTVGPQTMCIEDDQSDFYNQIIEEGEVPVDWNSTDHMLRQDDLYEWGVFVEHNFPQAAAQGGSCIFLHVWRSANSGTAGCTAMKKADMIEILHWLDETQNPQLVQMPKKVYREVSEMYDLPDTK
jgi:D-alanyl-D-alanine dipeptidase